VQYRDIEEENEEEFKVIKDDNDHNSDDKA